jgi:vacuolar iron transporter family protein
MTATTAAVSFVQRTREVVEWARRSAGVTGPGHEGSWYATLGTDMSDAPTRPPTDAPASAYDRRWLAEHLAEERRESSLLGEIREVVFGAQDGLVSTLAVVATVAGASGEAFPVVVAGVASALAGVFSMAAGEYIGSKSQREIFDAQIHAERHEVRDRPGEAEAEVAYMLTEEGLDEAEAAKIAALMARHPEVLLRTMVARELGIQVEDRGGSVLRGALFMGAAFGLGALVPVLPFVLVPFDMALQVAAVVTGAVLFAIGVVKSRWSHRSALSSGLEVLALAAVAGVAGYLFGTLLPQLLGVAGLTA